MIINYAYVKFREDGETRIVSIIDIKGFDRESHHEEKCYLVAWRNKAKAKTGKKTPGKTQPQEKNDDQIDEEVGYYKAQILLLGETKEELEERLTHGRRIRIPRIADSSVESESDVEMESFEEPAQGTSGLKRKLEDVGAKNKENNVRINSAKASALKGILAEKLGKRRCHGLQPGGPACEKMVPVQASGSGSGSGCQMCQKLQKKLKDVTKERDELRQLNMRLQKKLLDKLEPSVGAAMTHTPTPKPKPVISTPKSVEPTAFSTPKAVPTSTFTPSATAAQTTPSSVHDQKTPVQDTTPVDEQAPSPPLYVAVDGQVSLGAGIFIPEGKLQAVSGQVKNSLMVKNLAVAVWGTATLKESSVTGTACNRYKDHAVRPGLNPAKLQAVKDYFAYHLKKQPLSEDSYKKELAKFNGYIREKIADLRKH